MKKTLKKGFTIVELVIVIAVVAILAAVLIPTFVSVTKKANESKDTQLVRNLNTALAVDTEVGKHTTMQSALEAAEKAGYDVAKINTSATDNEILWDSVNDCFVYKKGDSIEYIPNSVTEAQQKAVKDHQYWIISNVANDTYSTYLYSGNKTIAESHTVKTGLDVGNETVTSVNYVGNTEPQTVTIRTNGGALTVNAQNDTVHHYDFVMDLSVNAVSSKHCYYEHGFVGNLKKFDSGKFVTTSTARFYQKQEEIANIFAGNSKVTTDFTIAPKYEQNIYNENEVSIIDGKPGPKHIHEWDDGEVLQDRNCGKEGRYKFICLTCHTEEIKTEPATGIHSYGTDNICSVCGKENDNVTGEVTITVDNFLALKNVIENIAQDNNGVKKVKFRLGANLSTSATSLIVQPINTEVVLDLNGCTLELYNSKYNEEEKCYTAGFIARGRFEVIDSSETKTGKIIASKNSDNDGDGGLITVEKFSGNGIGVKVNTQFVLSDGTIDSTNNANGCAIMMWHSGSVLIEGGKVLANSYSISGSVFDNGSWDQGKLIINGGEIVSTESYAIYHPQHIYTNGAFTINNGTIKGKNGALYVCGNSGNNADNVGTATDSGVTITINGGIIESESDHIIYVNSTYLKSAKDSKFALKINGGTFKAKGNAYLVKAIADKGVRKSKQESNVNDTSTGLSCYLSGGTYIGVLEDDNMYIRYHKGTINKCTIETIVKSAGVSKGYSIVNNADGSWSITK